MNSEYSSRIRLAMKTTTNSTKAPMTIEQVATLTGFSYESIRKIYAGHVSGSKDLNDALCHVLNLDPEEMWEEAQRAKIALKLGSGILTKLPQDDRLVNAWPKLSDEERAQVITVVEGLAQASELRRQFTPRDPKRYPGSRGGPGTITKLGRAGRKATLR